MAVRGETSWRPRRQCPPLRHQRPACVSGSPESEARGLRGQGGRIQRGQSSTQTTGGPGPRRGFIQHHFVSIQTVQKEVTSLWGKGAGNSGRRCSGSPAPVTGGGPRLPAAGAGGTKDGTEHGPRPRPAAPQVPRALRGGAAQGPKARTVQRKAASSHTSSASSASTTLKASRAEPRAEQTHHGHQAGEEGTESPRDRSPPRMAREDLHTPRRRSPPSDRCRKGQRDRRSRASSPIQMKALGTRSSF